MAGPCNWWGLWGWIARNSFVSIEIFRRIIGFQKNVVSDWVTVVGVGAESEMS